MSRTRLRLGAGATLVVAAAALQLTWYESAHHSLVLVGPLNGRQIEVLLALVVAISACALSFSFARQLAGWRGRLGTALADGVGVVTALILTASVVLAGGIGLLVSLQIDTRLAPLDHGKQVVVEEISFLQSEFFVYRGNGVLFDVVSAPPSPTGGDVVVVDHWSVTRFDGQYLISYATSPHGALRVLFTLR